jgi:hypothetical protein
MVTPQCFRFAMSIVAAMAYSATAISAPVVGSGAPDTLPAMTAGVVDLTARHRLVIVGEVHGSMEVPALILDVARRVTDDPALQLVVALEMPDRMAPALDRFLTDKDPAGAQAEIMADAFWTWRDGRSSQAMLALITGLRELGRDGRSVSIVPFDASDTQGDAAKLRDANMAVNVRRVLREQPQSRILLLTGNYHARTTVGAPWDADLEHMAYLLRDERPLTLDARSPTGSVWVCNPDCGVYEFGKQAPPADAGVRLFDTPSDAGYHGEIVFPRFTASPPVLDAPDR